MGSIENEMDRDATFLPLSPPARSGCPPSSPEFPQHVPTAQPQTLSPRQVPREPDRPARPLIFEARWHLVGISSHCDKYFPTHHHATNPFHDNTPFAPPSTPAPIALVTRTASPSSATHHIPPSQWPTNCKRSSTCRASSSGRASSSSASRRSVSDHQPMLFRDAAADTSGMQPTARNSSRSRRLLVSVS